MAKGKRGFQPGNTHGKVFSSQYQPKRNGRKPALYNKILQNLPQKGQNELSKGDYYKIIRYLMERTPSELNKILDDAQHNEKSTVPIWIATLIKAMLSDIKKGEMNILNILFDRLFGKSGTIKMKQNINMLSITNLGGLTIEELKQLEKIISKIS